MGQKPKLKWTEPTLIRAARKGAGVTCNDDYVDDFTAAYIRCALWSTNDESDPETGGNPLDKNYGPDDLDPDALKKMVADCAKFQKDNAYMLEKAWTDHGQDYAQCGHDFWLTRNGHGAGFWDGDYSHDHGEGIVGKALTKAAKEFGETWLYVGDDGKIYHD